jgi:hypothetical protein
MVGLGVYNSNTSVSQVSREIKQTFVPDQPLPKEIVGGIKEAANSAYEKDEKFRNLVDIVRGASPATFQPRSYVSDIPDFQHSPSVELKRFTAGLRMPKMPKIGINVWDRSINKEKSRWQERFNLTLPGEPPQLVVLGGALKGGKKTDELFLSEVLPNFGPDTYQVSVIDTAVKEADVSERGLSPELQQQLADITGHALYRTQGIELIVRARTISPDLSKYREVVEVNLPGRSVAVRVDDQIPEPYKHLLALDAHALDKLDVPLSQRTLTGTNNILDDVHQIVYLQDARFGKKVLAELKTDSDPTQTIRKYLVPMPVLAMKALAQELGSKEEFCLEHALVPCGEVADCGIDARASGNKNFNKSIIEVFGGEWEYYQKSIDWMFGIADGYDPTLRSKPAVIFNSVFYRRPDQNIGWPRAGLVKELVNHTAGTVITPEAIASFALQWDFLKYDEWLVIKNDLSGFRTEQLIALFESQGESGAYYQQRKHSLIDNVGKYKGQKVMLNGRLQRRFIVTEDISAKQSFGRLEEIHKSNINALAGDRTIAEIAEMLNRINDQYVHWFREQLDQLEKHEGSAARRLRGKINGIVEFYELEFPGGESSLMAFNVPIPESLKDVLDADPYFLDRFRLTAVDGSYIPFFKVFQRYQGEKSTDDFNTWLKAHPEDLGTLVRRDTARIPIEYVLPHVEKLEKFDEFYRQDRKAMSEEAKKHRWGFMFGFPPSITIIMDNSQFTLGLNSEGKFVIGYTGPKGTITATEGQLKQVFEPLISPPKFPVNDGLDHLFHTKVPLPSVGSPIPLPPKSIESIDDIMASDDKKIAEKYGQDGLFKYLSSQIEKGMVASDPTATRLVGEVFSYAKNHDPKLYDKLKTTSAAQVAAIAMRLNDEKNARNPLRPIDIEFRNPKDRFIPESTSLKGFLSAANDFYSAGQRPQENVIGLFGYEEDGKHHILWRREYILPNGATYMTDTDTIVDAQRFEFYQKNPGFLQNVRMAASVVSLTGKFKRFDLKQQPGDALNEFAKQEYQITAPDLVEIQRQDPHIQKFYINPELHDKQPDTVINGGQPINVKNEIQKMMQE